MNQYPKASFFSTMNECMNVDGDHVPNLVVVDKVWRNWLVDWKTINNQCTNDCGPKVFNNNDDFCLWLLKQDFYIGIALNLRVYDGLFIMKYMANNHLSNERPANVNIPRCKLMSIQCGTVKLIDSYIFIPFTLSKFSQTFGIENDEYQQVFFLTWQIF